MAPKTLTRQEMIEKVKKRVSGWKDKPDVRSSHILNAFFELEREQGTIKYKDFLQYCKGKNIVRRHDTVPISDMTSDIIDKYHQKVFQKDNNGIISLWEPLADFIRETWIGEKVYNTEEYQYNAEVENYQETEQDLKESDTGVNRDKKFSKSQAGKVLKTDPKYGKRVIRESKNKCEYKPSHETFTSDSSRQNFVEAHHLIPLSNHEKYEIHLDCVQNIVALCPNCHRQIHLAKLDQKEQILKVLFDKRKERLQDSYIKIDCIKIDWKTLLQFYGISESETIS